MPPAAATTRSRGPQSKTAMTYAQRQAVESAYAFFHAEAVFCELFQDQTGLHSFRTGRLASFLAARRGLDADTCFYIEMAARLHDIGLLYLDDEIIEAAFFSGPDAPLPARERRRMQTHCRIGREVLKGTHLPNAWMAAEIAENHHEHWDGTGYPAGKVGLAIPEVARIFSICDAFDVMVHPRSYRDPIPIPLALAEIRKQRGKQFDPAIADLFEDVVRGIGTEIAVIDQQIASQPGLIHRWLGARGGQT